MSEKYRVKIEFKVSEERIIEAESEEDAVRELYLELDAPDFYHCEVEKIS